MEKIVLFSLALLMSGCAHEMPIGEPFKSSVQTKLNSASHWDVLAHYEAAVIRNTLVKKSSRMPVFIKKPDKSFPFAQAYHHLLTSSLAAEGVALLTKPEFNAATISYVIDVVEHSGRYQENRALLTPLSRGVYNLASTTLGAGIADVATTTMEVIKSPFYAIGGQITPNYATLVEVVITTQMSRGTQMLNSDSRVYYVEKSNLPHYTFQKTNPLPHHFTVTDHQ